MAASQVIAGFAGFAMFAMFAVTGCEPLTRRTPDDTIVVLIDAPITTADPRAQITNFDNKLNRLVASGLGIADGRARLRAEIDTALTGRTPEGSDALIEIAVELRALSARRVLTAALRAWSPIHAVTGAITLALLVVHVAVAVMR